MVAMAMCVWFREVPYHVEELCLPRDGESGKEVHSEDRGSHGGPPQLCPHSSAGLPGRDICFSSKGLSHTNPGGDTSVNPAACFTGGVSARRGDFGPTYWPQQPGYTRTVPWVLGWPVLF